LTVSDDSRVTVIGSKLRKLRLDEIPQLFNILFGTMSFVGTRPEIPEYVREYTDEMLSTLLLPAGLTSKASILFRNEATLLSEDTDIKKKYLEEILPIKMIHNLEYLRDYSFFGDIKILFQTIFTPDS
jgi:lipopolysaccharide/colanic/teichoic acid biosynthesis glycosyltransferase